uniref:C-type lectin domain-containing protein n=1 Tax=Xiphophorus maculatus TaxID=8083 RepID=A0A3B5QCN8_XIPMA
LFEMETERMFELTQKLASTQKELEETKNEQTNQYQYHFVSGSFTWREAQAYCRQKHTDLATIQSPTEVERVLDTLSSAGHTSEVWIGLYSEMDWRWSDGFAGNGAEYRDWETSDYEPDFYYAYQFCVLIANNGKYWDDSCSISYPFICYNGNEKQLLHSYIV